MLYVKLLEFSYVSVRIPRKKMLRVLDKKNIKKKDYNECKMLIEEIENAVNKLNHVKSIAERILLKTIDN